MELDIQQEGEVLVITPGGHQSVRIDTFTSTEFEVALREQIADSKGQLVIDLNSVTYISSAGIRVFVILAKELAAQNRNYLLCSLSKPVHEVFTVTGIDKVVSIFETRDDALASLKP